MGENFLNFLDPSNNNLLIHTVKEILEGQLLILALTLIVRDDRC